MFVFISVGRDGTDGRDGIPGTNGNPGSQGLPGKKASYASHGRNLLYSSLFLSFDFFKNYTQKCIVGASSYYFLVCNYMRSLTALDIFVLGRVDQNSINTNPGLTAYRNYTLPRELNSD